MITGLCSINSDSSVVYGSVILLNIIICHVIYMSYCWGLQNKISSTLVPRPNFSHVRNNGHIFLMGERCNRTKREKPSKIKQNKLHRQFWEVDCKPLKKMRGNISWRRSHHLPELIINCFDGIDGIFTPATKGLNNNRYELDAYTKAGFLVCCEFELSVFPHTHARHITVWLQPT